MTITFKGIEIVEEGKFIQLLLASWKKKITIYSYPKLISRLGNMARSVNVRKYLNHF